jgi:hypothetical protein
MRSGLKYYDTRLGCCFAAWEITVKHLLTIVSFLALSVAVANANTGGMLEQANAHRVRDR